MSYQITILVGNLGKDPEMRYTPSGTPVTSLNVATNRKYTGADGQTVKETTWFRVSVFGKAAEACAKYLKKGSEVLVEGRLTPDKETGGPRMWKREDGTTGANFELFANTVRFLGGHKDGAPAEATGSGMQSEEPTEPSSDENVPF